MKKKLIFLFSVLICETIHSQVTLDADGPGNTYELITSVLAPSHNPIEVPDCNHSQFGKHITEVFDSSLNTNVFKFHIHKTPDNDRCQKFDRQRNEIKSYSQSPDNLLGVEGETVRYKWKFKLDSQFQSSSSFTHLHQLKAVGGSQSAMPLITLTTRKANSNDKLQLRYAESTSQITLLEDDLTPFLGQWVEVNELVKYGNQNLGSYSITIKRVSDNAILFNYNNSSLRMWKTNADFVRPKWGIYRSLNRPDDLRDETVLFANFSIEEVEVLSVVPFEENKVNVFPNPVIDHLTINSSKHKLREAIIYNIEGKTVKKNKFTGIDPYSININDLKPAIYFIHLKTIDNQILLEKIIKQ